MSVVAMIPTYNESGNIAQLIRELLALPLDMKVLVVDDLSPDGTYAIVQDIMKAEPRVQLLLRRENRGRGWAGIDGFKQALAMGAKYIVEMDADFSHPPRFIPAMLERAQSADIVIGSRYVAGGRDEHRSALRRIISALARRYLSLMLGVSLADPTSGFRLFRRAALEQIVPFLSARDPFIVTEVIYHARTQHLSLAEVPIEFMERRAGTSKLDSSVLFKYLFRVIKLRFSR